MHIIIYRICTYSFVILIEGYLTPTIKENGTITWISSYRKLVYSCGLFSLDWFLHLIGYQASRVIKS